MFAEQQQQRRQQRQQRQQQQLERQHSLVYGRLTVVSPVIFKDIPATPSGAQTPIFKNIPATRSGANLQKHSKKIIQTFLIRKTEF